MNTVQSIDCIEETRPIRTSVSHTKRQFSRITSGDVAILLKASINGIGILFDPIHETLNTRVSLRFEMIFFGILL